MKEKYKILLTCHDPYCEPYYDEISGEFDSLVEAQNNMMRCAIEEADSLNETFLYETPISRIYGVIPDGNNDIMVYVFCIGNNEPTPLTEYHIMPYSEYQAQEYNGKLREKYGDGITVEIKVCTDEYDNSVSYYYTTKKCGDSDLMDTVEAAFESASEYLNNIDLYV